MKSDRRAFVVWITGLPASGKSTIAVELIDVLKSRDVEYARLESDALRKVMFGLDYSPAGRDSFYATLAWIAKMLVEHGVSVVIDATASRRRYRDDLRGQVADFVEVYVDTPLEVCRQRDPKGLYRRATTESSNDLPGVGADYEVPSRPEVTISGTDQEPRVATDRIVSFLESAGLVDTG